MSATHGIGGDPEDALRLAERVIDAAKAAGADEAEALVVGSESALTRFANSEIHQNVFDLLAGRGGPEVDDFRFSRDDLVRRYRDWLRTHGPGYAEIGLASAFVPTAASAGSTSA